MLGPTDDRDTTHWPIPGFRHRELNCHASRVVYSATLSGPIREELISNVNANNWLMMRQLDRGPLSDSVRARQQAEPDTGALDPHQTPSTGIRTTGALGTGRGEARPWGPAQSCRASESLMTRPVVRGRSQVLADHSYLVAQRGAELGQLCLVHAPAPWVHHAEALACKALRPLIFEVVRRHSRRHREGMSC